MAPINKTEIVTKIEKVIFSRDGQEKGVEVFFLCPTHDDHNPSARWNPEKQVWYCDVCKNGGGVYDLANKLRISDNSTCDTLESDCNPALDTKEQNENNEISNVKFPTSDCTLASYAQNKGLPVSFLSELGLVDFKKGKSAIKIPYLNTQGDEVAVRFRTNLKGTDRFRWRTGSKPQLYGLWKIQEAKKADYVVLVEGESDCHTLWYHKFPTLGLPGASNWKNDWEDYFEGIKTIYVLVEPDQGGQSVLKWLAKSKIRDRVKLINLESCKDPSELYLKAPDCFAEDFKQVLECAIPWSEQQSKENKIKKAEYWKTCKDLAEQPNILNIFEIDLLSQGFVGETKAAKLIYLALTSRFFQRPVSLAVKGPSSGGKSYLVEKVISFFPESACHVLTAMSEKTLIYSEEPLAHRFLVLFEAAGMSGDMASYLIRSLLSEGKLKYETTEKTDEGFKPRLISKEGPTGLLTTTTSVNLHPENETRFLSLNVLDTPEQTKAIMMSLAKEHKDKIIDFSQWHTFQEWLSMTDVKVKIPYAEKLANKIPPTALRLRRDFHHILILIRTHALIHQATRDKTPDGQIIATFEDYEVIRNLISEIISQGIGASVSDTLKETIEAVRDLSVACDFESEGVTVKALSDYLKLDPSAVNRRVKSAIAQEFLQNLALPRKKMILKLGAELPDAHQILPSSKELSQPMQECSEFQGVSMPPLKQEVF